MNFRDKPILGMIHCSGTNKVVDAIKEVKILQEEGVDGVIIENYHGSISDVNEVLKAIRKDSNISIEIGINILPNDFIIAFALAREYGASFIQLDYVSGNYENTTPFDVELYQQIRDDNKDIVVLGGVHPKYYKPIKGSILEDDINNGIKLVDAIVVTGAGTGKETPLDKIKSFRKILGDFPLIIGAGITPNNVYEQLSYADGAIVGSCFKKYGRTQSLIKRDLVEELMFKVNKLINKPCKFDHNGECLICDCWSINCAWDRLYKCDYKYESKEELEDMFNNEKKIKYAVQAVILNDKGEVLAVSRKDNHNDFGLVGGKVDLEDLNPEEAMARETFEETGLRINTATMQVVFQMHKDGYMGITYLIRQWSGEINTNEPHMVKWVPFEVVMNGSFGNWNTMVHNSLTSMGIEHKLHPDATRKYVFALEEDTDEGDGTYLFYVSPIYDEDGNGQWAYYDRENDTMEEEISNILEGVKTNVDFLDEVSMKLYGGDSEYTKEEVIKFLTDAGLFEDKFKPFLK